MINFKLAKQVFLYSQIEEAAKKTGLPLEDLQRIALFSKGVMVKDTEEHKEGEIVPMYTDNKPKEEKNSLYGPDAFIWICKKHGFEPVPVSEVHIPYMVFYERTSDRMWISISSFAAKVKTRSDRVGRLDDLNAPDIIISNEWRMLQEYVQRLETNEDPGQMRWEDGTVMRALCDVGYSLAYGWSANKQAEFEERSARNARELEIEDDDTADNEEDDTAEGESVNG